MRFWEVDALRGLAVLAMILSNGLFDLTIFRSAPLDVGSGPLLFLARATAILFIALLGLSLHLRAHRRPFPRRTAAKRAAFLFLLGLIITAITALAFPAQPVLFGVLHFAGVATLLCYPLIRRPRLALALAGPIILAGLYLGLRTFPFPWLLPLGFAPAGYQAFDYFALLPWLGVALAGLFAGSQLYPQGRRAFHLPETAHPLARGFAWLGRHSLVIYFAHQPVLVALILAL